MKPLTNVARAAALIARDERDQLSPEEQQIADVYDELIENLAETLAQLAQSD